METHIGFAAVQPKNGTITIPAQLRRRFGLDKPGAQVEIVVRDGEIVLLPHVAVPAEQAWFWSARWQANEREADTELAAGHATTFDTAEDFLAHLERIDAETDDESGAADERADER
ncbi:AbrB/MazE/SpoVT family DNA-binding domain-containing protein [Kribbella solani]|uniref:AbrB/MazE/SpoVT family DNA-binding domain-containing protein n=1 Tax=Kribbella solani TaxID=236067 RepID=UPI0029B98F86|nr:AbrB/MazE/SpoVT family DNA-binding domain-containing protein [Kribbella solani]MDX2971323.1 AbrB/MazE/SpoVT family DNA-binding domain-containing protein [Kribbella solani]MDX3000584.1 AbrB/MazE/SpoVT family DNA-binding domain-containing protein [Kribbella solani]